MLALIASNEITKPEPHQTVRPEGMSDQERIAQIEYHNAAAVAEIRLALALEQRAIDCGLITERNPELADLAAEMGISGVGELRQ